MDDFEKKLSQQPLKQIPGDRRAEILAAARDAGTAHSAVRGRSSGGSLSDLIVSLLWPNPKAWAGLAAVWIFILILNFSMRDTTTVVAEKVSMPQKEVTAELKQQRQMLAELIGSHEISDADRSKSFVPLPRSERTGILSA